MSLLKTPALLVLAVIPSLVAAQSPPPPPAMPAEIAAALKQHEGKWRTEARIVAGDKTFDATATWDCQPAAGGSGLVCNWAHFWPGGVWDRAIEVVGYDPAAKDALTFSRVTDKGIASTVTVTVRGNTLIRRWEGTQEGKPLVGINEVRMTADGPWTQKTTVDVAGKRVSEMQMTHRRVQ
jgi:hypothetical protein